MTSFIGTAAHAVNKKITASIPDALCVMLGRHRNFNLTTRNER
jgi:hypothetical protein